MNSGHGLCSVPRIRRARLKIMTASGATYILWPGNSSSLASDFGFEPSENDGRYILNEVLMSGNFGKMDRRNEGIYVSKWKSFLYVNTKAIRFAKFDYLS